MYHDPYSGQQIKAYRRDPTGRWSPIVEVEEYDDGLGIIDFIIVVLFSVAVAMLVVWGI